MHVSIKDIAQAAGVSHSTVSRALGDSPLVKAETKAHIKRLAQEMGYTPDAIARSLVTRQTRTVGVVVTTITDPFVAEVVQGIEDTALENDYSVILASSAAEPDREVAAVEMLRAKRVDSVIVTSSRVGALYLEHLERIGVPVVLINNHNEQSGRYTFSVSVDNQHGGHLGLGTSSSRDVAALPTCLAQPIKATAQAAWLVIGRRWKKMASPSIRLWSCPATVASTAVSGRCMR